MRPLVTTLIAAGLIVLLVLSLVLGTSTKSVTELGPAGDFFGGFANPIFAFLAFVGVVITAFLQRNSLEETRKQAAEASQAIAKQMENAERQTFESALFQMLNLHNNIVEKITVESFSYNSDGMTTATITGREAIENLARSLHSNVRRTEFGGSESEIWDEEGFKDIYQRYWSHNRQNLGHYYRFLFNMIRILDESVFAGDRKYIRLIRAQLSDYELLLLFYNCLSSFGPKFKRYVEIYSLFDNMPSDIKLPSAAKALFDPRAFRSEA